LDVGMVPGLARATKSPLAVARLKQARLYGGARSPSGPKAVHAIERVAEVDWQ
jgi:hypothetical protein